MSIAKLHSIHITLLTCEKSRQHKLSSSSKEGPTHEVFRTRCSLYFGEILLFFLICPVSCLTEHLINIK